MSGLVLLVFAGVGCSMVAQPTALPTATAARLPTSAPLPTALPPTSAPIPTATPPASTQTPKRISFAPGGTWASVQSNLAQNGMERWVIRIFGGQTLTLNAVPTDGKVMLIVSGADGNVLQSDRAGVPNFTGKMPSTQDYYIDVRAWGDTAPAYTLLVSIPPLPTPDPRLQATRISFQPGGTSATVQGTLAADASDRYVLRAQAGQIMSALALTSQGKVDLSIYGADGTVLIPDQAQAASATGNLPSTQDYFIQVNAVGNTPAAYTLMVTIPPLDVQTNRITFPAGGTTTTVQGELAPNTTDRYVLRALAGQTMTVKIVSTKDQVILRVWATDGQMLVPDQANATNWTGRLPGNEDYIIDAWSIASANIGYTLQVTVPPLSPTVVPDEPRRITFPPGGTTATVQGTTATPGQDRFVIRALAGQTMSVNISSTQGPAILLVYGADGDVLLSDHAGAASWSGTLRTTQDYFIDTRSVGDAAVPFTLTVTIPPLGQAPTPTSKRISFAPGGTTVTLQGALAPNGLDRYVLRALGGQTLTVNLTPSIENVTMQISGADGSVLVSGGAKATTWSGVLPSTQDYFITVLSNAAAPASYSLQVTIPPL